MKPDGTTGLVLDIDGFAVHDGPGIRMAVYLKGCPLSCEWCHSPESQRSDRELVFFRDRCTSCGICVSTCPASCHSLDGGAHRIDRTRCTACGACVEACPNRALQIKGEWMSADEVIRRAARLEPFFRHSGGGVTITGGEICEQTDFTCSVLEGCRRVGIRTAVETSGVCDPEVIDRIAELSDLILFDLKLADDRMHRRFTGAPNGRILGNLARLPAERVVVRVPLIPGITDTEANIRAVAAAAAAAGKSRLEFLPYNPSAAAKYEWIGRPYTIEGDPQPKHVLDALVRAATAAAPVTVAVDA